MQNSIVMPLPPNRRHRLVRIAKLVRRLSFPVSLTVLVLLLLFPVRTTLFRLAIIAFVLLTWGSLLLLVWPKRGLRLSALLVSLGALVFLALPGRPIDQPLLRETYLRRLRSYDDTRYVYGGENVLGIDCSGLVRAAMTEALAIVGVRGVNPRALRSSLQLWWRDSNAIDLGTMRSGLTMPVDDGNYRKLSEHETISPGDLAVTESGSHVLAYLGSDVWIEAEPAVGGTHIFDLAGKFSYLADERVRFVRWKLLANRTGG